MAQQAGKVRVRVTPEILRESWDDRGRRQVVVCPWPHAVYYNKEKYTEGMEFEIEEAFAKDLLVVGHVHLASEKSKPFRPPGLDRKMVSINGVRPKGEVDGMVPSSGPTRGWEDSNEMDD